MGYEQFNNKLGVGNTLWKNLQTANNGRVFGTSWTFDLMRAGGMAKPASNTEPLLFNGTGGLGMMINLGINKAYVSDNNQKQIDGDQKLFGLMQSNGGITLALKANTQSWDYNNAIALSDLLVIQTLRIQLALICQIATQQCQDQINDQTKALRDFYCIHRNAG